VDRDLSVVVVNVERDPTLTQPTLEGLTRELTRHDQVVWVDRTGSRPQIDLGEVTVDSVAAPGSAGRGELYGLGLEHVDGSIVAFTDSTTVPRCGWRSALVGAFADGRTRVAGGPVLPAVPLDRRARATFIVEYGPHATAPFRSASGDLSANNIAYRSGVLRELGGTALWKTEVNQRLRRDGVELDVVPGMQVEVTSHHDGRWLVVDRFGAGRLYGSHAARRARPAARAVRVAAGVLLPFVLLGRALRPARKNAALRTDLLAAVPDILLASIAWSVGETVGWATARPPKRSVM
jgi:hypothetical protein